MTHEEATVYVALACIEGGEPYEALLHRTAALCDQAFDLLDKEEEERRKPEYLETPDERFEREVRQEIGTYYGDSE